MENRPWERFHSRTPMCLQTQNCSRQLVQSRSLAVIHRPCLWDDKALDYAWLRAISKLTPGTGRANLQSSQCADTCAKQGTFLLPWRWTRDSDYLPRELRHPTGPYFCASLNSRSICPGGSTKVDRWTVGLGRFPMVEFTATFFFALRLVLTWRRCTCSMSRTRRCVWSSLNP